MATGDLDEATVEMVRLAPGVSKQDFERALGVAAPRPVGSLLTWLHDDWYALAPNVSMALERQGSEARGALQRAGARSRQGVAARSVTELALMRDSQRCLPPVRARTRAAGLFIEPPVFSRPGQYPGRSVSLDWHVAAVGLPARELMPRSRSGTSTRTTPSTRRSTGPRPGGAGCWWSRAAITGRTRSMGPSSRRVPPATGTRRPSMTVRATTQAAARSAVGVQGLELACHGLGEERNHTSPY